MVAAILRVLGPLVSVEDALAREGHLTDTRAARDIAWEVPCCQRGSSQRRRMGRSSSFEAFSDVKLKFLE